jgi:putative spermidine/putrescine transport system permease protein
MRRSRRSRGVLVVVAALVVFFLIAPTVIIIASSLGGTRSLAFPPKHLSLHWYRNFFTDAWLPTAVTSLKIAAITAVCATVLGTMAALSVVRGRFPGRQLLQALFIAPLIVPTVILGVGLFEVFGRWHITGSILGLVLAHTALAIPFVMVTVGASLRTIDPTLERAAANLGASPVRTFMKVTLPLMLPGVAMGALFAFITSLDEVVVAIFLTSPTVMTLPVQIFATLQNFLDPTVAAISAMLFLVTVLVLVGAGASRRREERFE